MSQKSKSILGCCLLILSLVFLYEVLTGGGIAVDNSIPFIQQSLDAVSLDEKTTMSVSMVVSFSSWRYYIPFLLHRNGDSAPGSVRFDFSNRPDNVSEILINECEIVYENGEKQSFPVKWNYLFDSDDSEQSGEDDAALLLSDKIEKVSDFTISLRGHVLLNDGTQKTFQISTPVKVKRKFRLGVCYEVWEVA